MMYKKWQSKLTSGTQKSLIRVGAFVLCCRNIRQGRPRCCCSYHIIPSVGHNSAARSFGHMLVCLKFADNYVCRNSWNWCVTQICAFNECLEFVLIVRWLSVRRTWFLVWGQFWNNWARNYWLFFIIQNQCILYMYYYHCHYFDD